MANNSANKIKKLEETLVKFKQVDKGEHRYSELCKILNESELEHGTQKRKTQIKHWKEYMDIEYLPKTDTWLVKEVYEERLLEKISSSQYYERMCYILYLYLYQLYRECDGKFPEDSISIPLTLSSGELYKLFGLVNDRWGVLYENYQPTYLQTNFASKNKFPVNYSEFVRFISAFSKTVVDNCLKSLRDKRLINYYTEYQVCTYDGRIITLDRQQTDLLTKVERRVLDEMYDNINWDNCEWKDKSQFGMRDIYARNKLDDFRSKVCFEWECEEKESGGGFGIKWYRCIYTINAIRGYFERYINDVIKNDIEYAELCLERYRKELNDISFKKFDTVKKREAISNFKSIIPKVEKMKDNGNYVYSKNLKMYNEILSYYYVIKFGKYLTNQDIKDKKFPDETTAISTYLTIYNKMLYAMVKRTKNS